MKISSSANPKVKAAAALRDKRIRQRERRMLVEGTTEIERALQAGVRPFELFTVDPTTPIAADVESSGGVVYEVTGDAHERLAVRGAGSPVLVAAMEAARLSDVQLPAEPLLLVVEGIEKPGNLGAMVRTADGAGVHAVFVADPAVDVFSPNVIRASLGTVFAMPVVATTGAAILEFLRSHGVQVVATSPTADLVWSAADLTGSTACVVGAEHAGLSESFLASADTVVAIPMRGVADSLNASASAAILLYEACRQRDGRSAPDR